MIEEIQELYSKVKPKHPFITELAKVVDRAPNTIRTHWFSNANFWSIPLEMQKTVKDFTANYVTNQNN
ncbi:hypothetical protein QO206_13145 [Leeuwenhoekiella aequorea]|uniref:hypothetical protein n=1 Tax=Leeuwenhoekiella aequorea TaxID=283736 RepID=UPI00352E889C|tara:strand:+ start:2755 stop:2958 length:204 start_codon:yes stop_codon:yes gene_type:complete